MISDGRLVDTAHLRSQKCAVSEANAQFCPLILSLTIQQVMVTARLLTRNGFIVRGASTINLLHDKSQVVTG